MAFLRPYKSILQSELVRSSNNSTIPVKYQGEREGEKNFSLQPDSFYSFFPFFLSFLPTVFIRRQSGWVSRNFQRRGNCNKGRGKGFISDLRSLRIWDVAEGRGMVSWEEQGYDSVGRNIAGKIHFLEISYTIPLYEDGLELRVVDVGKLCKWNCFELWTTFTPFWQCDWLFPRQKAQAKWRKVWRILFFELLIMLIFDTFQLILKFV